MKDIMVGLCALKLEGTIYLCKFDTEIKRK